MQLANSSPLRRIPWRYRQAARRAVLWPRDFADAISGRRHPLVPPRRLQFVGDGDYLERGLEAYRLFARLWKIGAESTILDIGCGIGRMAVPFITDLGLRGEYQGFDIVPAGILWAQRNISRRHPNFHFQWAAIYNERYNPGGTLKPQEYHFPYADGTFDFAFATSVFTHMWGNDVRHYLQETRRVLKANAGAVFTFFVVNDEVRQRMAAGESAINLREERDQTFYASQDDPMLAVGFEEAGLLQLLQQSGLEPCVPIERGHWSRRQASGGSQFQDAIVVRAF